jgi:hypothetical protein
VSPLLFEVACADQSAGAVYGLEQQVQITFSREFVAKRAERAT